MEARFDRGVTYQNASVEPAGHTLPEGPEIFVKGAVMPLLEAS